MSDRSAARFLIKAIGCSVVSWSASTFFLPAHSQSSEKAGLSLRGFNVSQADRTKYRVGVMNNDKTLVIKADILRSVLGRHEAILPERAIVELGASPTQSITYTETHIKICDGKLGMIMPSSFGAPTFPDLLYRLKPIKGGEEAVFYASADSKWFVKCRSSLGTCENVFVGPKWTSQLIVDRRDICEIDKINRTLSGWVARWVR